MRGCLFFLLIQFVFNFVNSILKFLFLLIIKVMGTYELK